MSSDELTELQRLKISLLGRGISVSPAAQVALTENATIPMSVHEYPTTGGLTLVLPEDVYANSPFDHPFARHAEATLLVSTKSEVSFQVSFRGEEFPVRVLPLPGYLSVKDSHGRLVTEAVFSHADRARLSPVGGCHNTCGFCDSPLKKYELRSFEQLIEALSVARADAKLPIYHVLISGGTPAIGDSNYYTETYEKIIKSAPIAFDVMIPPNHDTQIIDRFYEWGVRGFAINLELYNDEIARRIAPQKRSHSRSEFAKTIVRAVDLTGGSGRVRSLLLVGLESERETLKGVEFLASLGCDPVLSPFRPASGTALAHHAPPSNDFLERVYLKSIDIVERYGVKLGPRCVPCTHNALTFADLSGAYYFSRELK